MKVMTVTAVLWAAIGGLSLATAANAAVTHFNLHIPREPLDAALRDLAHQTGVEVGHFSDQAQSGLLVGPVQGSLSPADALGMLLRSTGLSYRALGDRAYIVATPSALASAQESAQSGAGSAGNGPGATHSSSDDSGVAAGKEGKSSPSPGFRVGEVAQGAGTGTDSVKSAKQQSVTEESPLLQEIVVTAQKYTQRAFDVPISLQVISGNELVQHGITDLANLQYDVPGLYMDNTGTQRVVFLRGVGNYLGNGAMVGQYIDDADITAEGSQGGTLGYDTGSNGLYDLNRVEVLKGPQGTLYGDGSMGGVIRYITNKPVLDQFQVGEDVSASFTQNGAPSQDIETMLNTPLAQGTLGLRFAGIFEHEGGWVDEPAANLKNINGENVADVRAELLWEPTARVTVNAMQTIHRDTSGIGAGEDASGNITPLFGTTFTPNMADDSNLSNMTVTYDLDVAKLLSSSIYSYGEQNIHDLYTADVIPGTPIYWIMEPYYHVNNSDASEELRLVSIGRGSWQWSVGGFYKEYREYLAFPGEYVGLVGATLSPSSEVVGLDASDSSRSWAGFVDTSYKLFKRLTIGAGVRYFKDRETQWTVTDGSSFPDSSSLGPNVETPYSPETFNSTDPRFYVQYQVTSHVNTYASASKGFRSGGPNLTPAQPPYQPESLWSYDLGTKIRYPEERIRADLDLFDMNYSNFVSTTYSDLTQLIQYDNVGKARIQGVDADLMWRLVDHWTLALNTEILHSEFLTAAAISGYVPGNRLPFAPKYSYTASLERDFHLSDKPGEVEVYYYEISRVQYRLAGVPLFQSDILRFLNVRADIHCNDKLTLGVFAHNLLNDRGYDSPEWWASYSTRPRPRTVGMEFQVSFGG